MGLVYHSFVFPSIFRGKKAGAGKACQKNGRKSKEKAVDLLCPEPYTERAKEVTNMELGNHLFDARKKCGFSQEEVAEKLGVSRQTISKWETGVSQS